MYALDVDPIEIVKTKQRLAEAGYGEDILTIKQTNFRNIDQVAEEAGDLILSLRISGVFHADRQSRQGIHIQV